MEDQAFQQIEAQAVPLMAELSGAAANFEDRITGMAFALAFLKCLAITTVLKDRDTEEGIEFLHDLLDMQIQAARRDKAEDRLKPPHIN